MHVSGFLYDINLLNIFELHVTLCDVIKFVGTMDIFKQKFEIEFNSSISNHFTDLGFTNVTTNFNAIVNPMQN
tara:strand:- start:74 stop:292 length:219 start_codon:yes stop_codon:yes gene_type:complete